MSRKIVETQLKNKVWGLQFQTSRLTEPWGVPWAYWRSTECPEQTHMLMGRGYMMELSLRRGEISCNNWVSTWENKNQTPNAGHHKKSIPDGWRFEAECKALNYFRRNDRPFLWPWVGEDFFTKALKLHQQKEEIENWPIYNKDLPSIQRLQIKWGEDICSIESRNGYSSEWIKDS